MSNVSHKHPAVTLSVRISPGIRDQLDDLSEATSRTKSFLAAEAIEHYLATHAWQIKAVEKSLAKANSEEAHFVAHDKVSDWLESWGTKEEQEPPK